MNWWFVGGMSFVIAACIQGPRSKYAPLMLVGLFLLLIGLFNE